MKKGFEVSDSTEKLFLKEQAAKFIQHSEKVTLSIAERCEEIKANMDKDIENIGNLRGKDFDDTWELENHLSRVLSN